VKREYKFHVRRYFEDFKKAVNDYISGLYSGSESVILMERALRGKPELINTPGNTNLLNKRAKLLFTIYGLIMR
jgi:hypothetical protein